MKDFKEIKYNMLNKGFSTMFVVIILGSVALTLSLGLSISSVWSIKSSVNTMTTNKTKALVDACAEVALEIIRENNNYTGIGNVTLNTNTCTYIVENTGGTTRLITITGELSGIIRHLNVTTSSFNPLVISSWEEVQ
ncbi:MAG: hypothetical protein WCW65_00265 [Candidatus Paceibacterota bacterium]